MNPFFSLDTVVSVFTSAGLLLILTVPGLLFYGFLADRAEFKNAGIVRREWFGYWDAVAATLLGLFFFVVTCAGFAGPAPEHSAHPDKLPGVSFVVLSLLQTEAIFVCILVCIVLVLRMGGFSWRQSLGLRSYPIALAVMQAVMLLLLAYPLIVDALQVWRVLIASTGHLDDTQQDAVRFLAESKSHVAKVIVAFQAVLLAPVQEELIFRGYLYGLARKHLGVAAGLVISSALFAGIHLHLPSFAALFTLALCLALAYEWTGSIFVPMAMHSLFNLLSVLVLFR